MFLLLLKFLKILYIRYQIKKLWKIDRVHNWYNILQIMYYIKSLRKRILWYIKICYEDKKKIKNIKEL